MEREWHHHGHRGGRPFRGRGRGQGRGHRHFSRNEDNDDGGDGWRGSGSRGRGRPPGLRGKDIGMYYAARSKAKKQMLEKQSQQTVNMNEDQEEDLQRLLADIRDKGTGPASNTPSSSYTRPHSSQSESSMNYDDSWRHSKSRGEKKFKDKRMRQKQHVGLSPKQTTDVRNVLSTEDMGEQRLDVNVAPFNEDDDLVHEDDMFYSGEEEMSEFMVEYSRHKELNQSAQGHCTDSYVPLNSDPSFDSEALRQLENKTQKPAYEKMLQFRRKLPAHNMKDEIVQTVKENQVVVISGDTGCGKTTQVAQFILDDYVMNSDASRCRVVCTQPRRISAISVAERVAQERVENCGNDSSVGYQIRLESQLPRSKGSILYCTTGIVLRWLMSDSWLSGVSHIILDEIHERDLHSDFLMIILKDLIIRRPDLKLILMSATLNAEMFSGYFGDSPMLHIPGFTFPVQEFYLEDFVQDLRYTPRNNFNSKPKWMGHRKNNAAEREERNNYMSWLNSQNLMQSTHRSLSQMDFNAVDVDLTVALVEHIHRNREDGAILVFMTGWEDIKKTKERLESSLSPNEALILPLHSLLPTHSQRHVFDRPPRGVRKIIVATMIAETSITIDDVVYVVNCGKTKMKNFDAESNITTLAPVWVSKASARQRRGRAGRVQPGECYHLYTHYHADQLKDYELPEMLRTPLEKLCLDIKMLKLGLIVPFISKAMQPPSMEALTLAVTTLQDLNALDSNEDLTPLGYHLAKMPLDPHTGKMLLFGAMFSCLEPILTVAASLDFKDAFYKPMDFDAQYKSARRALADGCKSDHILIAKAFKAWEDEKSHGNAFQFCRRNFLQQNTLMMLQRMRRQFVGILHEMKFVSSKNPAAPEVNINSNNEKLVRAVLCAGLYPNVAKIHPDSAPSGSKRPLKVSTKTERKVAINPASINETERELPSLWLVYFQKMKTAKVYLYDCTAVSPFSLLFFGGSISMRKDGGENCVLVDDWISFKCSSQTAHLVKELREELNNLLERKITKPGVTSWADDDKDGRLMRAILDLITTEEARARVSHHIDRRKFDDQWAQGAAATDDHFYN